jgi:hypothetical protein
MGLARIHDPRQHHVGPAVHAWRAVQVGVLVLISESLTKIAKVLSYCWWPGNAVVPQPGDPSARALTLVR